MDDKEKIKDALDYINSFLALRDDEWDDDETARGFLIGVKNLLEQ